MGKDKKLETRKRRAAEALVRAWRFNRVPIAFFVWLKLGNAGLDWFDLIAETLILEPAIIEVVIPTEPAPPPPPCELRAYCPSPR